MTARVTPATISLDVILTVEDAQKLRAVLEAPRYFQTDAMNAISSEIYDALVQLGEAPNKYETYWSEHNSQLGIRTRGNY